MRPGSKRTSTCANCSPRRASTPSSIATPNHSTPFRPIWACEAGKDVYVEKPVSHNVWEGRQLVVRGREV
jgi:hypothetical protein